MKPSYVAILYAAAYLRKRDAVRKYGTATITGETDPGSVLSSDRWRTWTVDDEEVGNPSNIFEIPGDASAGVIIKQVGESNEITVT